MSAPAVPESGRIVIVGLGHPHRQDDAVGLVAARALDTETLPAGPFSVQIVECTGDAADLIEWWHDAVAGIVIDAVATGRPPGTVHRFDAIRDALPLGRSSASTHSFGLAEAVELARTLGALPTHLVVIGVEAEHFAVDAPMSAAVAAAVPAAVSAVVRELAGLQNPAAVSVSAPPSPPAPKGANAMHEMSLLADLMKSIERIAREQNASRVAVVRVKLGALAHISPDHLREHFDESATGTVADGAELVVEQLTDETDPRAQEIVLDSLDVDD